jgi:hypothetical protein
MVSEPSQAGARPLGFEFGDNVCELAVTRPDAIAECGEQRRGVDGAAFERGDAGLDRVAAQFVKPANATCPSSSRAQTA